LVGITQRLKYNKWNNHFQYDVTYLVVVWERDNTGTDAKNHTWMNFAMCPSVCMGASFEQCGYVTDAKVSERHVEHQSSTLRERHQVNPVGGLEGEKDATTRMGHEVVGGMKWFPRGVLVEFF
jgi:hypothetical protein